MPHNGGLSQINLWYPTLHSYPFLNHLASTPGIAGWTGAGGTINEDLLPITLPSDMLIGVQCEPNYFEPDGNIAAYTGYWAVRWTGIGRLKLDSGLPGAIEIFSGHSFVDSSGGGVIIISGENPYVVFRWLGHMWGLNVYFQNGPGGVNTMTTCEFYREDHEEARAAGKRISPAYVSLLREINPGIIRFLNWDAGTTTNFYRWDLVGRTSCLNYTYGYRAGLSAGVITDVGGNPNVKIVGSYGDIPNPSVMTHGESFQATMANPPYADFTINSNGRGAFHVCDEHSNLMTVSYFQPSIFSDPNVTHTFYFHAGMNRWIWCVNGIASPLAIEVMAELCNEVGAHAWDNFILNSPDSVNQSRLQRWHALLNPGLKLFVEGNNENWNFSFPYVDMSNYCGMHILGLPEAGGEAKISWHAKEVLRLYDQIDIAAGGRGTDRFVRVLGIPGPMTATYNYDPWLFQASSLVPPPAYPDRPADRADVCCGATYISGEFLHNVHDLYRPSPYGLGVSAAIVQAGRDHASGIPALMTAAFDWMDEQLRNTLHHSTVNPWAGGFSLWEQNSYWAHWAGYCVAYSTPTHQLRYVEYEAAIEVVGPLAADCVLSPNSGDATDSQKIYDLIVAYKLSPQSKQFTLDHYNQFCDTSPACEFPSQFGLHDMNAGPANTGNAWSIFRRGADVPRTGVWEGIAEFNGASVIIPPDPPVLIGAAVLEIGDDLIPVVETDQDSGYIYMVVVPDGDNPTDEQVKLGKRSSGAAAFIAETQVVVAAGTQAFSPLVGLAPGNYDVIYLGSV